MSSIPNTDLSFFIETVPDPVCVYLVSSPSIRVSDTEHVSIFLAFTWSDFNSLGRTQCDWFIFPSLQMSKQFLPSKLAVDVGSGICYPCNLHMFIYVQSPEQKDSNAPGDVWIYS